MKKEYMKPAMCVVKLQQQTHILAESANGYDGKSLDIPEDQVEDEDDVF